MDEDRRTDFEFWIGIGGTRRDVRTRGNPVAIEDVSDRSKRRVDNYGTRPNLVR